MQLRAEALDGHLAKSLAPLYVITSTGSSVSMPANSSVRPSSFRAASRRFAWSI